MIKAAAIRNKETGVVWSLPAPARHHDLIWVCTEWDQSKFEQGFLTDDNRYVDRIEAKQIAIANNQLLPRAGNLDALFSEDVWEGRYAHEPLSMSIRPIQNPKGDQL